MANKKDLDRLRQGAAVWNDWRAQNRKIPVDLSGANLTRADLARADLTWANLCAADLNKADLSEADLSEADLREADLTAADLTAAKLRWARLVGTRLAGNHFEQQTRYGNGPWKVRVVDIGGANFREADLRGADFRAADLAEVDLTGAALSETLFVNVDLSATKGLDTCIHEGPSILDHRTLQRSGRLPLAFLRGCGLPDRLIDYLPSLLDEAIHYYSCFISYSSKDDAFAKRLHADLQNNGVRCWFAPHDLPIGAKTWDAIDEAIRIRDKLLLILSEHAIASDWVEDEVTAAFEEEDRRKQTVLFPVRLDDMVMTTAEAWAAKLRRQRNIGDFRQWKDHDAYQQAFDRVLRDLKTTPG